LKGHWDKFTNNTGVKFIMFGNVFYLITCIQGPLMALRNINEITSKTDWVIGHSHISLFATFSFFVYGGVYYVIPVLCQKPIRSKRLEDWHYQLSIYGAALFILPLWIGGFVQGLQWATWANGSSYAEYVHNLSSLTFTDTITQMKPWWWMRTIGGCLVFAGAFCFVVNMFNTIILAPIDEEEEAYT
jgi:cytochrome c oxidase cbb3-type subunit 1